MSSKSFCTPHGCLPTTFLIMLYCRQSCVLCITPYEPTLCEVAFVTSANVDTRTTVTASVDPPDSAEPLALPAVLWESGVKLQGSDQEMSGHWK